MKRFLLPMVVLGILVFLRETFIPNDSILFNGYVAFIFVVIVFAIFDFIIFPKNK